MRRAAWQIGRFAAVIVLVTLLTSLMLDLAPGNAAELMLGETATPEQVETLERQLGLDDPALVRYVNWVGDAAQGDLGESFRTGLPMSDAITERFPVTLEIAVLAMALTLFLSITLAMLAAATEGSFVDRVIQAFSSMVLAVPSFVVALALVFVVAVKLRWLPVQGWSPISEGIVDNLKAVALPVVTISLAETAIFQRVLRADMSETLGQDFVLLARSKGLTSFQVLTRHCLRPASVPLLTLAGLSFARLLGGTIIVEYVFSLPGLGALMINSVSGRDIVAVQALVLVIATSYLLINFLVDVLYSVVDPRVRER